jgi:hypothetical protein
MAGFEKILRSLSPHRLGLQSHRTVHVDGGPIFFRCLAPPPSMLKTTVWKNKVMNLCRPSAANAMHSPWQSSVCIQVQKKTAE